MYNILIIDDEELIRKSITKVLEINFPDQFVIFEASNASEGIKIISRVEPDIIITDICMNNMTGLEMLEAIQTKAKIIVITGYRDFTYAQQAISLNVSALILKPIHFNELIKAISDALKDIEAKVQQQNKLDNLTSMLADNLHYICQKHLLNKLYGINTSNTEKSADLKEYGFVIDSFFLILFEITTDNLSIPGNYLQSIQSDLLSCLTEDLCQEDNFYNVFLDYEKMIIILKNDFLVYDDKKLVDICGQFCNTILTKYEAVNVVAAISTQGKTEDDLHSKYIECKKTLTYIKAYNTSIAMSFKDIPVLTSTAKHHNFLEATDSLTNALKTNNYEIATQYISIINNLAEKLSQEELPFIKHIYSQILLYINSLRDERGLNPPGITNTFANIINMTKQCDNISVLSEVLVLSVNDLFKNFALIQKNKVSKHVQRAIDYINNNYQDDISLNDIAAYIYLSPVHLSRIFKTETGQNIIDYINELRIKKAKEFLASGEYKIYEVAEMVGIKNTNYFTILFKKHINLTPREYLRNIQNTTNQDN